MIGKEFHKQMLDIVLGKGKHDFSDYSRKEWLGVLKNVSHNRVLHMFSENALDLAKLTAEQKKDLKIIVQEGSKRLQDFRNTINFLDKALGNEGIPYLVVKTFKFIDYVTFDVDVLVPYEKFSEAQQFLKKGGCKILPHPRKQGLHQRNCVKKGLLNIDLHRNFYWLGIEHIDLDLVWKRSYMRVINGIKCRCPSLEVDYLLHNKQLAYERYYVTLLDSLAVTKAKVDHKVIRRQVKKYKWRHSYQNLVQVLKEVEEYQAMPHLFPFRMVLEQLWEVLINNKRVLFVDFGYYCFTFLRYFLSGKKRMPYYDHWFNFDLLKK